MFTSLLIPSHGACVARTNHHILLKSHESTWNDLATIDPRGGKTSSMKSFDACATVCLLIPSQGFIGVSANENATFVALL